MSGCILRNTGKLRLACLLLAAPKVIARDMDGLKNEAAIPVRRLDGWKAGRNGLACKESALFSAKSRKMARNPNKLTTSFIAAKE